MQIHLKLDSLETLQKRMFTLLMKFSQICAHQPRFCLELQVMSLSFNFTRDHCISLGTTYFKISGERSTNDFGLIEVPVLPLALQAERKVHY